MKVPQWKRIGIGLVLLLAVHTTNGQSIPQMISYQGVITANNEAFVGTGHVKFALVNAAGDESYWSNDGTSWGGFEPLDSVAIAVDDGLFMVMLGDTALPGMWALAPDTFDYRDDAHLRIWFSEDDVTFTQLAPDQPLGSTAYAMMAARVPFGAIGETQLANSSVTMHKIENGAVTVNKLATGSVTSNKIDWTTMPSMSLKSYAESGLFDLPPEASGNNAVAIGFDATASGEYSAVGGGRNNEATALGTTVGGGRANWATNTYASVFGGSFNTAGGDHAMVGGGNQNVADGSHATIGGGYLNNAEGTYATVGGGLWHSAEGNSATIAGGAQIDAFAPYSAVGGGGWHVIEATSEYATVGGGNNHVIFGGAVAATVAGGHRNWIYFNAPGAVIGGGATNRVATGARYATISGGGNNMVSNYAATVAGGTANTASQTNATVSGGSLNLASGPYATVSGGYGSHAVEESATVGGGWENYAAGRFATVAGGTYNFATNTFAAIGGGHRNLAGAYASFVGGGRYNHTLNEYATVGGGFSNIVTGAYATIGGGQQNEADSAFATVGGGYMNRAIDPYATIPGGRLNTAVDYAFAAGNRAKAVHVGSFVWGDSQNADIDSHGVNTVTFRSQGGTRFTSGAGGANQTVAWVPGSGTWSFSSDHALKEGFAPVDTHAVLEQVAALPLTEWNYTGYEQRHIGPTAQDFHAAFPLAGSSDTAINSLHLDGVALAAIQGLNRKVEDEVTRLRDENAELKARLERLEALLGP